MFTALDHLIPTPQIEGASKDTQSAINLIGMIAKGAVVGGLFHGTTEVRSEWFPDVLEKFGLKKLQDHGLPDVVEVSPKQLAKLQGKEIAPAVIDAKGVSEVPKSEKSVPPQKQKDFLADLGLDKEKVDAAIANGLSMKVPIEKLMKIATKSEEDFNLLSGKNAMEPFAGTGETRTSTLAAGVEQKAIENKLSKGFGELPEYKAVNMEEQAKLANDFMNKSPEMARKVALGQVEAHKGVIPEAVFVAVENKAIAEGDANTLRDLATGSKLTTEATAMGQRIATLATRDPESPTGAIKEVLKAREERGQKNLGKKKIEKAKAEVVKEIKAEASKTKVTKQDWASFIKSLEC